MNPAESPVFVDQQLASLHYDSWRHGMGQTVTVCPSCAYFSDGECAWCPAENDPDFPSDRPECSGCIGTVRQRPPWWQRSEIMVPLLTTIAVTTVATVASSILLKRVGIR